MRKINNIIMILASMLYSAQTSDLKTDVMSEGKPISLEQSDPPPIVFSDSLFFVELDGVVPEELILSILDSLNAVEVWREDNLHLAIWKVTSFPFITPEGDEIFDINGAVTRAKSKTRIRSASLDIQNTIVSTPTQFSGSCFNISDFAATRGPEDVTISILDTGISDISDNSTPGYNYNLTTYTGYDYVNNDSIPDDEHGHGSHLAGLIHSITHHIPSTESEINFDIRKIHNAAGQAFMSAAVIALFDAKKAGADIINMSFSVNDAYQSDLFYPLQNAISWAEGEGILVIAAAGNNGIDNDDTSNTALPASFSTDNIISVASVGCDHQVSAFSNYGAEFVDIAVIGEGVPGPDLMTGQVELSGTSQAAAITTALAALKGTNQVDFDYQAIKCALIKTSTHYVNLLDAVSADGIINPSVALSITNTSCQNIQDHCDTNFTGSNSLTGFISNNKLYETSLNIESDQVIEEALHTTYDAMISTILSPGFEVKSGAFFQIASDGCQN